MSAIHLARKCTLTRASLSPASLLAPEVHEDGRGRFQDVGSEGGVGDRKNVSAIHLARKYTDPSFGQTPVSGMGDCRTSAAKLPSSVEKRCCIALMVYVIQTVDLTLFFRRFFLSGVLSI
jgi:hypothetical protein